MTTESRSSARSALACAGFVLLSMCAALAAAFWPVDAWYASIAKPSWNPPNWVFGPVWTTLYIMIGVAAWRLWRTGALARDRATLAVLVAQWVLNFAWSGFFFGMRAPGAALVEIICLLALIAVLIVRAWRHDRVAAALLVPYILWVAFATALNAALWRLNA
ncbi:MAG: tryptophan-rich sensory protein [Planctomycetaceae bacterium]|jgi:benzodiazapine receptor|nr:tryptophan-rich sensory protein [Planctomycetaceae bacterium]